METRRIYKEKKRNAGLQTLKADSVLIHGLQRLVSPPDTAIPTGSISPREDLGFQFHDRSTTPTYRRRRPVRERGKRKKRGREERRSASDGGANAHRANCRCLQSPEQDLLFFLVCSEKRERFVNSREESPQFCYDTW